MLQPRADIPECTKNIHTEMLYPWTSLAFISTLITVVYIIGFFAGRVMEAEIEKDRLKAVTKEKEAIKNKKRR